MREDEADAPESDEPEASRRPRRFHPVRWLLLALLLTVAYWAASYGARPAAESWLSRTFGAPVKVVRVGFDPIDAVITLEGLVTRLPSEHTTLGPPVVADRARIDLQWFPLIHRRLQVREFTLEGAVIELEEAPDLAPSLEALGTPTRTRTLPDDWTVQVDRIALRDSLLKIRGASPESETVDVDVKEAEITSTRRRTSELGAATNLRFDASFEGGRLRAEGHYTLRDDGLAIMADVRATDVPVGPVLQHIPQLRTEALSGRLEAEMRYVLEPDHRNMLSGWARLRDAQVRAPERDDPSVEVRNAIADIAALDLRARRLHVRSLVLRGATFAPESQIGVTVLDSLREDEASRTRRGRSREKRWRWSVDRFDASGARLRIPGPTEEPMELVASVRGENLGPRSHWSPVRATFQHGLGSAEFEGSVRTSYEEPRLEGRLSAAGVDLPALAHEMGFVRADLVRAGTVSANVDVLLEPGAAGFGVNGVVSIAGATIVGRPPEGSASGAGHAAPPPERTDDAPALDAIRAAADRPPRDARPFPPSRTALLDDRRADRSSDVAPIERERVDLLGSFALGARRIDLAVDAPAPPKRKKGPQPPRRWHFDATLNGPFVHLGRNEDGWVLPPLDPEEPRADGTTTASTAPERADASDGDDTPEAEPSVSLAELLAPVSIGRMAVFGGHVRIVDDSAEPALTIDVSEVGGTALGVRLEPFEADEVFLQGYGADLGMLEIRALQASQWSGLEVAGEEIPLYLAGPYLERLGVPYRFTAGTGSFVSQLRHDMDGWTADTLLVLNRPVVDPWTEGPDTNARLGMSLTSAFKLLRDQNGDVRVRVPRLDGLDVGFDAAVYDAIRGAHEAPSSGGALTPTTIGFAPGQAAISPASRARLRSMARLVRSHPSLRIELAAPASLQDRRWFAERALLKRLDDRGGLMGALRLLGATDEKERIRRALQARLEGKPWYLEAHEEEMLDELLAEEPPVSVDELRRLAANRLSAVEKLFLEEGISYGRLQRRQISGQDRTTLAAVLVSVRAPERRLPPPDSSNPGDPDDGV